MPQTSPRNNTFAVPTNVVAFAAPADTFMTTFMFVQVAQAAFVLPAGWFTVALLRAEDMGRRQDHVMITRVAGPPIGSFSVWRAPRGRFIVGHLGEVDEDGDSPESGPYRTVEAAVDAIRADIALQLEAWGVAPVPHAA